MTNETLADERARNEAAYRALLDDLFEARRLAWQGGPSASHPRVVRFICRCFPRRSRFSG